MTKLLVLIPTFPLAGFLLLALGGRRLRPAAIHALATAATALSCLATALLAIPFLRHPPAGHALTLTLWHWLPPLGAGVSLRLDPLSLLMALVVTGVGTLTVLYAGEYMAGEPGTPRFFAQLNLFVFAMLVLVLADNLLLLYLGWEGVGLCSYLLIGHWHRDPRSGLAARKAFIVTRVGDTALAVGLF
ncbi:MAG TPA: proton-conducting transporter membrane subunit, partial [Candidatus Aminicenantes bacterium]|nr:proton-conducting transporter membrane subunit [Candidatus Aminicenantes bacterium]